jgi:hypothetical protein
MTTPYITLAVPSTNGSGAGQNCPYPWGTIDCYGTFDGGTVTIDMSPDGGTTWYTLQDTVWNNVAFTADGYANFERATRIQLRATLSGSSGSTDVTCQVRPGFADVTRDRYGS